MTSYPIARLCYVTQPEADTFLLNIQFDASQPRVIDVMADGSQIERVRISRAALANIIKDGVGVLG